MSNNNKKIMGVIIVTCSKQDFQSKQRDIAALAYTYNFARSDFDQFGFDISGLDIILNGGHKQVMRSAKAFAFDMQQKLHVSSASVYALPM